MGLFLDGYKRPKKDKKKDEKKTEVKKPQSSSASRVNERASNSTFMGGGASVKQTQKTSTASTKPRSSNQQTSTTKPSTPQPTKITKQRQATDTGTGRKTTTTRHTPTSREMLNQRQTDTGAGSKTTSNRRTPTAKEMLEQRRAEEKQRENERRRNRDANLNLKQTQAAASRRRAKSTLDNTRTVAKQNAAEWNSVKNKSKEEQQAWFTQKAEEAQERHAAENNRKVDKGTDNLLTSAAKAAYHSGKGAVHSLTGAIERSSMNDFYEAARFKYDAMRKGMSEEDADKFGNEKAQKRQQ